MIPFLQKIRLPGKPVPFRKKLLYTLLLFADGLVLGVLIKLFDLYTTNLGNVFSQMSVWIFTGTLIAVYSSTPWRAGANVFVFCAGMLLTYYLTAALTASFYSRAFLYGWAAFSLLSPLFAFFAWYAKGRGPVAALLSVGIAGCMLLTAMVLFHKIRLSDLLLCALTLLVLFYKQPLGGKKDGAPSSRP